MVTNPKFLNLGRRANELVRYIDDCIDLFVSEIEEERDLSVEEVNTLHRRMYQLLRNSAAAKLI